MSVNPRYYKGPLPSRERVKAAASMTWQAGTPLRSTDSGWVKCKSSTSQVNGLAASTVATATSAGDRVWVDRIASTETMFVGCITSAGTDTKCPSSKVGGNWGLAINSCIGTVSIGNDSSEICHIYDLLSDKEGQRNDTSDVPGKVVFGFTAAALTAEGDGL